LTALYILAIVAALSGLGILLVRTVLNAALALIVCLLSIAAIYIVLHAEFLAVVQILVYAGGILLLIIFGIMVTTRPQDVRPARKWPAFLLTGALTVMFGIGLETLTTDQVQKANTSVSTFGVELMTQYAAPFEFAGVLVLVSMVGAMITASFLKQGQ
jgi:NADH:ubiquinone oxidoreductase subunit 6 (subunit J)